MGESRQTHAGPTTRRVLDEASASFAPQGAPTQTAGPEDRLLAWPRVKDITGISRTTAWRMQKAGDFPEPVAISPKRVGWWESELTAWKATRKAGGSVRSLAPPRKPKLIETARSPRKPPPPTPVPSSAPGGRQQEMPRPDPLVTGQPSLPLDAPQSLVPARPVRRKRPTSADQIDFGF